MVELHKKRLSSNELVKPQKKMIHRFYSSKSFLTEVEIITSNYSADLPSLSIRQGDLPNLFHFSPPPGECQQCPCFWKFFRRSPPRLEYLTVLPLALHSSVCCEIGVTTKSANHLKPSEFILNQQKQSKTNQKPPKTSSTNRIP